MDSERHKFVNVPHCCCQNNRRPKSQMLLNKVTPFNRERPTSLWCFIERYVTIALGSYLALWFCRWRCKIIFPVDVQTNMFYLVCFIVQAGELILAALLREYLPNKSIRKFRIDPRVIAPSGVQLIRNRVKTTRRSCYNLSLSILLVWKINAYHYTQPTCTPNKRCNICFCDSLVKEYFTSLLKKHHKLSGKKPNKKMCTLQIILGSEN